MTQTADATSGRAASVAASQGPSAAERTLYTVHELDFVLGLRPTAAGDLTRTVMHVAPQPRDLPWTSAVTSGLRARGEVEALPDDRWELGEQAQLVATVMTTGRRWLAIDLIDPPATRRAVLIDAEAAVLLFVQDELDTVSVSFVDEAHEVPDMITAITTGFLTDGAGRTVSLTRLTLAQAPLPTALMFHSEDDGTWRVGHEPVDADGVLTASDLQQAQIAPAITRLWDEGLSTPGR